MSIAARPLGRARRLRREALIFASVGVVSTVAYAVLFLAFRTFSDAVASNALAQIITAIGNTAANRRFTFGVRDRGSMVRDQVGGLVALAIALAITTAFANLLAVLAPDAGPPVELLVLVAANGLATVARFILLRSWIVRDHRAEPIPTTTSGGDSCQTSPS